MKKEAEEAEEVDEVDEFTWCMPLIIDSEVGTWTHPFMEDISRDVLFLENGRYYGYLMYYKLSFEGKDLSVVAILSEKDFEKVLPEFEPDFKNDPIISIELVDSIIFALGEDVWNPAGDEQFLYSKYGKKLNSKYNIFGEDFNVKEMSTGVSLKANCKCKWKWKYKQ